MAEIPDLSANPYAPPEVHEPSAVVHELWKIQDGNLWVRNGAHIPGVDLATGEVNPDRPVIRKVTLSAFGAGVILQVVLIMGVMVGWPHLSYYGIDISPIWAFPVILLIGRLMKPWFGSSFFTLSYPENRRRARKRKGLWLGTILSVVAMFAWVALPRSLRPDVLVGVVIFFVCMSGIAIAATLFGNSPKAGNASDGWLHLKAIHVGAINYLQSLPPPHRGVPDPDRRSYVIHLEKFPWLSWCHVLKWKPLPCLNIGVAKLMGQRIPTRGVLLLKPVRCEAEKLSEAFRQQVGALGVKLAAGGWSFHVWNAQVVPDRFSTLVEAASFLHENRRDLLILAETTNSAMSPVFSIALYSWLEDGTLIRTSNERTFPIMNPAVQWVRKPGEELFSLISQHLQRSADRHAVTLVDGHEAELRLIQLSLDNHAWLNARGIDGALEEIYA